MYLIHFVVSNVIHHHNNDLFIWNSMTLQNLIGMANISLKQGKIIIILGIPSVIVLNGMQILLIVSQFIWLFAFFQIPMYLNFNYYKSNILRQQNSSQRWTCKYGIPWLVLQIIQWIHAYIPGNYRNK